MKAIKIDLPAELKSVELHTFADLHRGDKNSVKSLIQDRVKRVQNTPNAYAVLNGDIVNWASKMSVSDIYAEVLTPMEQIQHFTELFEPIKDKILSVTPGNHEARAYRTEGIDITQLVARQLGIEDRYSNTSALLFLRFGRDKISEHHKRRILYTVYINHGSGGGRKEGAKAIRLADMASIVDADIYIHSHTHLPLIMKQGFFRTDTANSSVSMADKLFVNTGACLEYGGYGEMQEFKPASTDTPVIFLDGTIKRATATL